MDQHLTRSSLSIFSSRRGKVKKTVVRITGFLLILLMVLAGINRVFKMKYGDGIYSLTKFYEQKKDSVDVLVLGSSHAFENINTGHCGMNMEWHPMYWALQAAVLEYLLLSERGVEDPETGADRVGRIYAAL